MNYMMIFVGATRINMPHLHQQIPKGMASPTDFSSAKRLEPGSKIPSNHPKMVCL
jgi:hypothetical protein